MLKSSVLGGNNMGNDMNKVEAGKNYVITVGRQFGSGGRKVAKKVADMLGIEFYDKGLIAIAAKESGLSEKSF